MRAPILAAAILAGLAFGHSAFSANTPDPASASTYKGIWISTPYPSLGVAAGEPVEIDLTVHDAGMPPQRVALAVPKLPDKWTALFLGGGRPVESAFVAPDSTVDVTLRILPPEGVKGGTYAYGNYPDIDALFRQQAAELDRAKREALLHKMQQLVHEKVIAAPFWWLAGIAGVGPRLGESMLGSMPGYPWTSPYEDMTVKSA